ncbi:ABC transporter permease [Rhodanobacter ginsengiterrae]|uniref:ABC transporter permease n=1 Tax=Rhodanobacter ginsengiterrae TaxID=2008451 RepID=UPI003CF21ADA
MIVREFRHAWRRLVKRPGYTALSAGVLGVGLGVLLFLFGMIDTLIVHPLPAAADQLMAIGPTRDNGMGIYDVDSDDYLQRHGRLQGAAVDGAYVPVGISLDRGNGPARYDGTRWTASMMSMLDVHPILGRAFSAADDRPGAAAVVLLGETLWRHDFHADPGVLGRAVRVNGDWATVVGVMPKEFDFPYASQLWMPLPLRAGEHEDVAMVARLTPGVSLTEVRQQLDALNASLRHGAPVADMQMRMTVKPLGVQFVPEDVRHWVWLMFAAGALVLLLACVNVANLQLVQTLNRRRELALRSALGCSRGRLMAGVLAESMLLGAMAFMVALPMVHFGKRWIVGEYLGVGRSASKLQHLGIDGSVLIFAVVVALLTTALTGLIPAWRASHAGMSSALREGSKGSGGAFARVAKTLVVLEIMLTVVLLVGAGTFIRSLDQLFTTPLAGGADASHVLTAQVALPTRAYADDKQRLRFFASVTEQLQADGNVLDVTAANTVPGAQLGSHETVSALGQARPATGWPWAQMGIVDDHFLGAYGVHLVEGRFFDARDRADSLPVTVIDRKTAQALWPGRDAVGQRLVLYPGQSWASTRTVIGVIEPLQMDNELEKSLPGLLMPLPQSAGSSPLASVGLALRTHGDPMAFAARLNAIVHGVDAQAVVYAPRSQTTAITAGRVHLVVLTEVFGALGLVALLLAAAGLYGVLAFSVAQRTREIGIRRAIGADSAAIVRTVGRQLIWQLGLGLGVGLLLAWPWSGLLADSGLHTQAHDMAVFVPVVLVVVMITLLAGLLPLIRALRVDPLVALRYE